MLELNDRLFISSLNGNIIVLNMRNNIIEKVLDKKRNIWISKLLLIDNDQYLLSLHYYDEIFKIWKVNFSNQDRLILTFTSIVLKSYPRHCSYVSNGLIGISFYNGNIIIINEKTYKTVICYEQKDCYIFYMLYENYILSVPYRIVETFLSVYNNSGILLICLKKTENIICPSAYKVPIFNMNKIGDNSFIVNSSDGVFAFRIDISYC